MANIYRVKLRWSGYQGGPGYSIFHFKEDGDINPSVASAELAVDRVDAWIQAIRTFVPQVVTLQTMADVETLLESDGTLTNVLATTPAAAVLGNASSAVGFAAAVGAVINWRTGGVRNGRRVRGKTFLVPFSSAAFEPNGTLAAGTITAINTAAAAMIADTTAPDMGVYARPSGPGATDGIWHKATSYNCPDMGAVLRSRRD